MWQCMTTHSDHSLLSKHTFQIVPGYLLGEYGNLSQFPATNILVWYINHLNCETTFEEI